MSSTDHGLHPARLLDDGRKLAGIASIVFVVSLFLPWYGKSVYDPRARAFESDNLSAFGAFTWIEAALLLVAFAVLGLLYLRSTDRRVELPGSDGTVIAAAGGWMVLLLIVRVFDKPSVEGQGATVGLQWGLLIAMAAAGGIVAAGLATRAVERASKGDAGPGSAGKGDGPPPPPPPAPPAEPATPASEEPTRFGPYGSSLGGRPPAG